MSPCWRRSGAGEIMPGGGAMARSKIPPTNVERMLQTTKEAGSTSTSKARSAELSLDRIERAVMIPRSRIKGMENQPRREIPEDAALHELARSIAAEGLLQPLIARADPADPGSYIIIAGHRRVAAADLLARDAVDLLADDEDEIPRTKRNEVRAERQRRAREIVGELPALLRDVDADTAYALALVENLQRENLSAREVMQAVVELQDRFGWSLGQIARHTHRNRGGLSVLTRVARYPDLAALVAEGHAAPSTAGLLVSLSPDDRAPFVARIRSGELSTVDHVESAVRARRAARQPVSDTDAQASVRTDAHEDLLPVGETARHQHPAASGEGNVPGAERDSNVPQGEVEVFKFKHQPSQDERDGAPDSAPTEDSAAIAVKGRDDAAARPDDPDSGDERITLVTEHVRRLGGSPGRRSTQDLTLERLCGEFIVFLADRPVLDAASRARLGEMRDVIQAYLGHKRQ